MDRVQPLLVFGGRTVFGVLLAVVLSMVGIGIAWGSYVFFGASSRSTLLALFTVGAGVGAGLGGFLAWLRIEGDPGPVLLATVLLALLAGIGGAWGGYEFGGRQEVPCCAKADIGPVTYTAFGAAVASNGAVLVVSVARSFYGRMAARR
jgi:hypothetical protein